MKRRLSYKQQRAALALCVIVILFIFTKAHIRYRRNIAEVEELNNTLEPRIDKDSIKITPFDPNTVELTELLSFGLNKYEALSIIRYRSSGKVFNIKEEVIGCYGISDSLYFALEPYIVIGEEFQYKPKEYSDYTPRVQYNSSKSHRNEVKLEISPFLADTIGVEYLKAIGALTHRQAEVFVKWRDMSGICSMDELRECYVVSDECADMLEPYIIFTPRVELNIEEVKRPVDLNKADIAELISIYGVGEKSALAILEYREKLGGFYSKEQLSEINIITESNFEKIIQQIVVDSCDISKIDVNFASAKELGGHPYIEPKRLRKLLKQRQLKGGWRTLEEIIEDDIFNEEEVARLRPYLQFEEPSNFYGR